MATQYYGVVPGGDMKTDVAHATSTSSRAIELVVNDATVADKVTLLKGIEAIRQYIISDAWKT